MRHMLGIKETAPLSRNARTARSDDRRVYWARLVAIVFVCVGALDAFSTELALRTGWARELNPLIRVAQEALGGWWIAAKMAAHLLIAGALLWYPNRPTLIAVGVVTLVTAAIAVNNLRIYAEIVSAASG